MENKLSSPITQRKMDENEQAPDFPAWATFTKRPFCSPGPSPTGPATNVKATQSSHLYLLQRYMAGSSRKKEAAVSNFPVNQLCFSLG